MAAASRPIAPPPRPSPAAADSLGASSALGMGPRNKVVVCAYCIYKAVGGVRSVPVSAIRDSRGLCGRQSLMVSLVWTGCGRAGGWL